MTYSGPRGKSCGAAGRIGADAAAAPGGVSKSSEPLHGTETREQKVVAWNGTITAQYGG